MLGMLRHHLRCLIDPVEEMCRYHSTDLALIDERVDDLIYKCEDFVFYAKAIETQ